jgi:hypothetical protein
LAQHDDKVAERYAKELAKFDALDQADIDETLRVLLTLEKGQKTLWWLLQIGKVGTQPFATDPYVTAFQAGELNVGQQILARLIDVNPTGYADMQMKRKQEYERRDGLARDNASGNDLFADSDHTDPGDE